MESEARKLCDLGKQFLDRGEPEEALRCYERAIDIDPENPDAWCGRGKSSYDLGRLERADRDFRRALRLAKRALPPEKPAPAKAVAPGAKGKAPGRRWWSDAKTRPYLRALHGHGLCLFWLGSYEDAARVFRKLLRLAPTDPLDVKFLVGETYLRMGRLEAAIARLAEIDDDPDALYNLGLARLFSRDFVGSVNAFRRGFFANLYLPPMLCERPADELPHKSGEGRDEPMSDGADDRAEHPTDAGTHPKGLDSEAAGHDYVDRCGDFWFGRPLLQDWLDGIRKHPLVEGDIERHLAHLRDLGREGLGAGERARIEGENTTLRSAERLQATDAKIAADVLAKVYALPPVKKA